MIVLVFLYIPITGEQWGKRMQNKTLSALESLKNDLHRGQYQLGERLPSERTLCEKLGLSRSGLRKVLSHLEAEDLIWRHVGRGTFAGPRPSA